MGVCILLLGAVQRMELGSEVLGEADSTGAVCMIVCARNHLG